MGVVANLAVRIGVNTEQFNKGLGELKGSLTSVSSALAGAFSVAGIVNAGDRAVEAASRIADMAARVGISAEAMQRLDFAAQQSGSSFEAVSSSIGIMADKLMNGSQATQTALAGMGLSLEQLRAMSPDQAFLAIANALVAMEDPMKRLDAGRELFGRGFQQLLPAMQNGFEQIAAQAPVMSNATVAALDASGDSMSKLGLQMQALQAQAFAPLLESFHALPESVKLAVAGIYTFMPSLEQLLLAVMAAGGPKAAFAGLAAAISGIGTMAMSLVPIFTTTIPAAFAAVIAFLGPQGLIALAVIALGVVWYKWGDQITALVQKVFVAVKTWLVDKFTEIVQSIKAKIDAVTGFFKNMYTAVVGGSFVPDMIRGIETQFSKLTSIMVKPAQLATSAVQGFFQGLENHLDSLLRKIPIIGNALANIDLSGLLGRIPGLGGVFGGNGGGFGGMGGGNAGAAGGFGAGLLNMGLGFLQSGLSAFGNHLKGGEEGMLVNPARDAYLAQFGGAGHGEGSGFHNLASRLTQITGQEGGGQLFHLLRTADSMHEFNTAVASIDKVLANNGGTGGGGASITINIGTVETADAESFIQDLPDIVRRNEHGIRTQLTELLVPTDIAWNRA